MPLLRRIPKRGFNNKRFGCEFSVISVGALDAAFDNGATVTPEAIFERGLLKRRLDGVKILGDGDLTKKLTVKAQAFSASAKEKITKAGGACEELQLPGIRNKEKTAEKK